MSAEHNTAWLTLAQAAAILEISEDALNDLVEAEQVRVWPDRGFLRKEIEEIREQIARGVPLAKPAPPSFATVLAQQGVSLLTWDLMLGLVVLSLGLLLSVFLPWYVWTHSYVDWPVRDAAELVQLRNGAEVRVDGIISPEMLPQAHGFAVYVREEKHTTRDGDEWVEVARVAPTLLVQTPTGDVRIIGAYDLSGLTEVPGNQMRFRGLPLGYRVFVIGQTVGSFQSTAAERPETPQPGEAEASTPQATAELKTRTPVVEARFVCGGSPEEFRNHKKWLVLLLLPFGLALTWGGGSMLWETLSGIWKRVCRWLRSSGG